MANRYHTCQDFAICQPFFSFHVKDYQEVRLSQPFCALIYTFTTYKCIDRSQGEPFMICIPDGCVDMVWIRSRNSDKVELIGTPLRHKHLIVYPDAQYFGVRMKPGTYFPVQGLSIREITDTEMFLPHIPAELTSAIESLFLENGFDARLQRMLEFFTTDKTDPAVVSDPVQQILYLIHASKGNLEVQEIAKKMCYSERHITRMFTDAMGYSPKMFSRIVRFQYALSMMMQHAHEPISDYMDKLSYSDQSHFQREFRDFTGLTPKRFLQFQLARQEGST